MTWPAHLPFGPWRDVLSAVLRAMVKDFRSYRPLRRARRTRPRVARVHELKTWPESFGHLRTGRKTAELRRDDRGYRVGDVLRLREWDPTTRSFTGRNAERLVTHVLRDRPEFGLLEGFVLLSLTEVQEARWPR